MDLAGCETNDELERRLKDLSRGLLELVEIRETKVPWTRFEVDFVPSTVYHNRRVQFIHQSVLDFITDEGFQILNSSLNSSTTFAGQSHFRISRTCIRYICMEEMLQLGPNFTDLSILSRFPLLRYATQHWLEHAIDVEANNIPQEDLLAFFNWPSTTVLDIWIHLHYAYTFYSHYIYTCRKKAEPGMDLLHVASKHGLVSVVRACLNRIDNKLVDLSADLRDIPCRTPLSYAAESGHEALVKIFLARKDVDVNSRKRRKAPPILTAAGLGHTGVVKLLLEQKEIDVNLKSKTRSPLSVALNVDHEAVVKLLLARDDIDMNVRYRGKSMLSTAVIKDNQIAVKMLLAHKNIDVNIQDTKGSTSTPLCWAVILRRKEIVKMLLAHSNIDINQKDKWGYTAVEHAVSRGEHEIERLLREHGATIPDRAE